MEELELSYDAYRKRKLHKHLENSLAISWKVKHSPTIDSASKVFTQEKRIYMSIQRLVYECSQEFNL